MSTPKRTTEKLVPTPSTVTEKTGAVSVAPTKISSTAKEFNKQAKTAQAASERQNTETYPC